MTIGWKTGRVPNFHSLPDIKATYAHLGLIAASNTPEQFGLFVQEEIVRWAKVVKASGARAD